MLITEVHVEAFGKLKEEKFSLRAGLSVITGDNEIGKTTMADFIKNMMFGLKEGEEDYRHYYPYDFTGVFGGSIKVLLKTGLFYEIRRSFLTDYLRVTKVSDGSIIENPKAWMEELCQGVTKEQFQKSGYISQGMFLFDAERYKDSIEKDSKRKNEEGVRSDLLDARELLSKKRERYVAQLDDTILQKLNETEDQLSAETKELIALRESVPMSEQKLSSASAALSTEREKASVENSFKEKKLLDTMLADKQHLAEYVSANERVANKKNTAGIVFLVIGLLVGLMAFFFRSSYGTEEDLNRWIFLGAAGLACLAILVGLIITIIVFAQKKKAKKALENRDMYLQRLAYSERAYQSFMSGDEGTHEFVANESEREIEITVMAENLNTMKDRMESLAQSKADKAQQKELLAKEHERQKEVRAEIKALDIAIGTLTRLAGIDENSEEAERSAQATDLLLHMNDKRDSIISIENDIIFVTENGRRVLFSDLSTSSMQEVLFAVRLAILNELDAKKELPLILDESFANLDGDRLQRVMKFVRACGRQAILFSCQPREKKEMAR